MGRGQGDNQSTGGSQPRRRKAEPDEVRSDEKRFEAEGKQIQETIYALMEVQSPRSWDELSAATKSIYRPAEDRFKDVMRRLTKEGGMLLLDDEDQIWLRNKGIPAYGCALVMTTPAPDWVAIERAIEALPLEEMLEPLTADIFADFGPSLPDSGDTPINQRYLANVQQQLRTDLKLLREEVAKAELVTIEQEDGDTVLRCSGPASDAAERLLESGVSEAGGLE